MYAPKDAGNKIFLQVVPEKVVDPFFQGYRNWYDICFLLYAFMVKLVLAELTGIREFEHVSCGNRMHRVFGKFLLDKETCRKRADRSVYIRIFRKLSLSGTKYEAIFFFVI